MKYPTAIALVAVLALLSGCDSPAPSARSALPKSNAEAPGGSPAASEDADKLAQRRGERPQTSDAPDGTQIAHEQKSQNAPRDLQEALLERVTTLPGVSIGRSFVSVQGARAFHLQPELAKGPREAFAVRQEFGHLHPPYDGSLHLNPGPELRAELIEKGWAEAHPRSSRTVMVYGPRDEAELEVVWQIVQRCYERAAGMER